MTTALRVSLTGPRFGPQDIPAPFRTDLERHGTTIVVVASGEIDLSSADRLNAQLTHLLRSSSRIVLDLRRVDFLDSTGLHCMLDIDLASHDAGVEFVLIPGPEHVQRLFRVTGAEQLLRFTEPGRLDRIQT
jgi:anti-sigma B factor antagonist